MKDDFTRGKIVGWIFWIVGVGVLALGGLFLLAYISMPVMELVGEALGSFGSAFNIRHGSPLQSLAVLCIIIIGIVGLAKVMTRRK